MPTTADELMEVYLDTPLQGKQRYENDRLWAISRVVHEIGEMDNGQFLFITGSPRVDRFEAYAWAQVYYPLWLLDDIAHLTQGDPFSAECVITGRGKVSDESDNWRINCFHPAIPVNSRW